MNPITVSHRAVDIVDELSTATTENAFLSIGDRTARQLGFKSFAYLGFDTAGSLLLSTYPRLWTRRYFERDYQLIDPVIRKARACRRGFYWDASDLSEMTTRAQRQLFSEAMDFGVRNGVTIPIHAGFGQLAALTFATDERFGDFSVYIQDALDDLHFIALSYHFHAHAKLQLKLDSDVASLTQRELQCLTWSANGKTMLETADILKISARTVRFHLDNAKAKLCAATVAAAVHEASYRGLLSV